jgi:cysteinyl-tRNA synthetase
MKIHNTLTGNKEEFIPINPGTVKIYACGVTVYDYCHIGHARSAIVFDVMRKYLRFKGYDVTYVRNFTDIDDKIINRAKQEGIPWDSVARKYTEEYYCDMDRLGVERADKEPKATEHIKEITDIVKGLVEKGIAYVVEGDVYFEIDKFPEYGKLSKRDKEEMLAGARVGVDERKRNPMDFALWKSSKEGEPAWESTWGPGRPGWHIECSAMSLKHLGEEFDIHGGGADLIFPHHENEIAQSESFTGKPFARYWVHNGFITINKEKMSKSLGNFFTIRDILLKFDPEVIRLFLLATHYRSPIEFSDEQVRESEISLDRFYSTVQRIEGYFEKAGSKKMSPAAEKAFEQVVASFNSGFEQAMDDDFNTALALGHIFELLREINRYLDSNPSGEKAGTLIMKAKAFLIGAGNTLGIFNRQPVDWYRSLMVTKHISLTEDQILGRIRERENARGKKDWELADSIRRELEVQGIILEDKKDRTDWKIRTG